MNENDEPARADVVKVNGSDYNELDKTGQFGDKIGQVSC